MRYLGVAAFVSTWEGLKGVNTKDEQSGESFKVLGQVTIWSIHPKCTCKLEYRKISFLLGAP